MRIRHPLRAVARALLFRAPIEAQLIVTRRCNLSCGYCSEYDGSSPPIPLETLKERIDALHRLRVVNIAPLGLARDVYRTLRRRIAFALVSALALLAATAAPAPAQARAESVRLTGMTLDHWSGAGPALLRPTLRLTKYSGRRPGADLALAIFPDAISFHPPALVVGLQAGLAQPVAIGPGALLVKVGGAGIVAAGVQAEGAFFHLVPGIHAGLGALIPVDRKSTLRLDVTRHVYRAVGRSSVLWSFGFGFAGGLRPPE
jgi:hypothetical protein